MWHIVLIGYLFVAVMFSVAQPGIARALIYLFFWAVLPMLLVSWITVTRHRNRLLKQADQAETQALRQKKQAADKEDSTP